MVILWPQLVEDTQQFLRSHYVEMQSFINWWKGKNFTGVGWWCKKCWNLQKVWIVSIYYFHIAKKTKASKSMHPTKIKQTVNGWRSVWKRIWRKHYWNGWRCNIQLIFLWVDIFLKYKQKNLVNNLDNLSSSVWMNELF